MKTSIISYKTIVAAAWIILYLLILAACSPPEKRQAEKEALYDQDNKKIEKQTDEEFLISATKISLEEIQLGELALKNSSTTDVKEVATMMIAAHSQSLEELKTLASQKQINIPTAPDGIAYEPLKDKKDNDFNKDYSDLMVNGHKDAIRKFSAASVNSKDPDIMTWAASMLPELQKHLEKSLALQEKYKGIQR